MTKYKLINLIMELLVCQHHTSEVTAIQEAKDTNLMLFADIADERFRDGKLSLLSEDLE